MKSSYAPSPLDGAAVAAFISFLMMVVSFCLLNTHHQQNSDMAFFLDTYRGGQCHITNCRYNFSDNLTYFTLTASHQPDQPVLSWRSFSLTDSVTFCQGFTSEECQYNRHNLSQYCSLTFRPAPKMDVTMFDVKICFLVSFCLLGGTGVLFWQARPGLTSAKKTQ